MCISRLLMFYMGLMVAKVILHEPLKTMLKKYLNVAYGFTAYGSQRRFFGEHLCNLDATTKKGFRETRRSAAMESDGNCNSNNSLLTH